MKEEEIYSCFGRKATPEEVRAALGEEAETESEKGATLPEAPKLIQVNLRDSDLDPSD